MNSDNTEFGDGSYDNETYDNGSYDDGSYDDGSYDDGTHDDGTHDDGTHDDGTHDDGTATEPKAMPNLYRQDLSRHEKTVTGFVSFSLTPPSGYGHVCTKVCQKISGAWESPASDTWVRDLGTLGANVKAAFSTYKDEVNYLVSGEPLEVMVPGDDAWKADWAAPTAPSCPPNMLIY